MQSITDAVAYNKLNKYEIIYVDSDSTDDSIERVRQFRKVSIIKLTGDLNAGIARNVGVKESNGDVFFFIDGDMEIQSEFLKIVYSEKEGLIHDFISGNWINFYYNESDELIKKENYRKMEKDMYEKTTGGLFLINKKAWNLVGGINERFRISEDIDIGLRLAGKGIYLLRKKETAAIHHTIAYLDKKRMWSDFLKMDHLYGRSFLYRKHILNKHIYPRFIRNDYTLLTLIISIIIIFFYPKIGLAVMFLYVILISLRSKFNPSNILYYFLRDLSVLFGFLFFIPNKNKYSIESIS